MNTEHVEGHYPFLTVAVCTFNRSERLKCCLGSLAEQSMDPASFEVIIIDNNSTDDTSRVVEEFVSEYPHFRVVSEPQQGLSHARNRGFREARGTYVAYIDDDAEAFPGWIEEIVLFVGRNPDVAMFGGPHEALVIEPVPTWFPPECCAMDLGSEERPLNLQTEFIAGMNMIIRKDLLLSTGGFNPDLGMVGAKVYYGEETKLQLDLKTMGHETYYVPKIKVRHYVSPKKMSLVWLLKAVYAVGRCSTLVHDRNRGLFGHIAGICYGGFHVLKSPCKYGNIPLRRLLFYGLSPLVSEIGAFHDYLSSRTNISNREAEAASCSSVSKEKDKKGATG